MMDKTDQDNYMDQWEMVYAHEHKKAYNRFDADRVEYSAYAVNLVLKYKDNDGRIVEIETLYYPTLDDVDRMVENMSWTSRASDLDDLREEYADAAATEYADEHWCDPEYIEMYEKSRSVKPKKLFKKPKAKAKRR